MCWNHLQLLVHALDVETVLNSSFPLRDKPTQGNTAQPKAKQKREKRLFDLYQENDLPPPRRTQGPLW